jgi:hypothetical protein
MGVGGVCLPFIMQTILLTGTECVVLQGTGYQPKAVVTMPRIN